MRSELRGAFEDRQHLAPDPDQVLAGVRAGVSRRRVRRRYQGIGAAVAAVLAVLATVVTINAQRSGDTPVAKGEPGTERTTTIELGWVPDDLDPPEIESTQIGDTFDYRSPGGTHALQVWVDNLGWKPPFDTALGPHESWTEVNGRRARVTLCCGYVEVAVELPSGRWAVVARSDRAPEKYVAPLEKVREQALRVASSIREGSGIRLRVGFVPDYLPPGHQVIGVRKTVGAPEGFGQVVTAGGSLKLKHFNEFSPGQGQRGPKVTADAADIALISVSPGPPLPDKGFAIPAPGPNTEVQGQPAYQEPDGTAVTVPDFHGGFLRVEVNYNFETGGVDRRFLPAAELVKIAEGVRWVG